MKLRRACPKPTLPVFIGTVSIILLLQALTARMHADTLLPFRREAITGFNYAVGKHFAYFYHHLGLFPLVTRLPDPPDNPDGAQLVIDLAPETLRMELDHWARFGESARVFMFYPAIWLTGQTSDPDTRMFTVSLLWCALAGLAVALYRVNRWRLGLLLVVLLGSNPFVLVESFVLRNVSGVLVATAVLLMALSVVLVSSRRSRFLLAIPAAMGFVLGLVHHIRAESAAMSLSCILACACASRASWRTRSALVLLFLAVWFGTRLSIADYFERTAERTARIVEEAGAVPFRGGNTVVHPLWHSVFCGLGDFDETHGYAWDDRVAYAYALPILNRGKEEAFTWDPRQPYRLQEYYDETGYYYRKPETLTGYAEVIRDKVLHDIRQEPLWFVGILLRRAHAFFADVTPMSVALGGVLLRIPSSGYILLPIAAFFVARKRWFDLKMALFTVPLGAATVLIYSGGNNSFLSIYHLVCTALIIEEGFRWLCPNSPPHSPQATAPEQA